MSDISDRLGVLAREATEDIILQPIELALRVRSRRHRRLALSAATAVALGGVTTGLVLSRQSPREVQVTAGPLSPAAAAVPWIDKPAPSLGLPTPVPRAAPPANAPFCQASQVTVTPAGGNGAGGHLAQYLTFTNISQATCLLSGYPKVVATEAGRPPVTAERGDFFGDPGPAANVTPGKTAGLTLETDDNCPATFTSPPPAPLIYNHVAVYLPGGVRTVTDSLNLICGLSESRFGVPQPASVYQTSPLFELRASMELPASERPGQILNYVIDLTNPTPNTIELTPCPGYLEFAIVSTKLVANETYALNCNTTPAIGANETLRYAMRMQISPSATPGTAQIHWTLALSPGAAVADGSLEVRP